MLIPLFRLKTTTDIEEIDLSTGETTRYRVADVILVPPVVHAMAV